MLAAARNEAKERYHRYLNLIKLDEQKLRCSVNDEDFRKISDVTDKSKESAFLKKRSQLQEKFSRLSASKFNRPVETVTKHVKSAVLNLTTNEIPNNQLDLLNLGPQFVPTQQHVPYMDIITSTECIALKLDKELKNHESERLRSDVSNILSKFLNKKIPSNLNIAQINAIKELKSDHNTTIYPFDKGAGFAVLTREDSLSKLKEQLGEAKVCNIDPTMSLVGKFQSFISQLRKKNKIDNKLFYKMYPSDAIPPRMYGLLKAHKISKGYPMRCVVSTIGTPSYGASEFLVQLIQPTLSKSNIRVKNSSSFVDEAKTWNIGKEEVQVSFDVVALYPSVPISKAVDAITDILSKDMDDISTRTKLTLKDIRELIELCLCKCYFLWENEIYFIEDAGPIGLSLMVVVSEAYLQFNENISLSIAILRDVAPITYRRYVDDSHSRFKSIESARSFKDILNDQDPRIQYTMEEQLENGSLSFLDVTCINNGMGNYEFNVFRKEAITNVQIKPNSSIDPRILEGVFKGFLSRAKRICSEKYLKDEIAFLINIFVENGHNRTYLESIAKCYDAPMTRDENTEQNDYKNMVKLPWIPILGPRLRKVFKNQGIKVVFTSTRNLQDILCNNKCKLPQNSYPGVYQLECSCGQGVYIGETKKRISTRTKEHEKNAEKGRWNSSGAVEHCRDCHGQFNWQEAKTLAVENNYYRRQVRESLEIRCQKTGPGQPGGCNKDYGKVTSSRSWNAFFDKFDNHSCNNVI